MSDSDRGAYAPHYDEALSFDSYDRRPRGRAPLPMALVASVVVLLLVCTALVMFYRSGSKGEAGAPRPVGGKIGAIKTAPSGVQPTEPGVGLEVYSPQNVPSASPAPPSPTFAPQPEQPIARPAPPPTPVVGETRRIAPLPAKAAQTATVAQAEDPSLKVVVAKPSPIVSKAPAADPVIASSGVKPAAASESDEVETLLSPAAPPRPAEKVNANAAKLAAAKSATQKLLAAAARRAATADGNEEAAADEYVAPSVLPKGPLAPKKPAAAKASAAPHASAIKPATPAVDAAKPAPKGGFSVQVGAFTSSDLAQKGFSDAAKRAGSAGGAHSIKAVQKDGKTFYRSTIAGFSSREAAAAYCAAVRAKGGPCIVH